MRLSALLVLAFAWAAPVTAQTVPVRSGEHDGFSRLAIALPSPQPWQLGRDGDGYLLRLDTGPGAVTLDPAGIYTRISRDRIAAVSVRSPGEMRIALGCDCHANAFELQPGLLVIDLLDGPPSPSSRFEAALPVRSLPIRPELPAGRADDTSLYWRNMAGTASAASGTGLDPNIAMIQARDELLSQLARAAAQGLVEVEGASPENNAPPVSPLLQAQTVMDRDLGASRRSRGAGAAQCTADGRFDLPSWREERPFAEQIGEARSALLGEFDRPVEANVTRLVRLYLAYGLAAEARDLMRSYPEAVTDRTLLLALSAIIDGHPEAAPGAFADQVVCEGPVALWAFLAHPTPGPVREIARGAILRGFSVLPAGLRHMIGPELSSRFLARNDLAAAQDVAAAMHRAPGPSTAGEAVAAGRLAAASDTAPPPALEKIAEANDPESPEALLLVVEDRLSRGMAIGPDLAASAATLAFEFRSTPLGPRLARAQVLSLGAQGAFDDAYRVLDGLTAAQTAPGLAAELLGQITAAGTDTGFLNQALRPGGVPDDAPAKLLAAVATRYLTLGFPGPARALLSRPAAAESDPLLQVRAALEDGDPREALRRLAGEPGPQAEVLRARALTRLGDFPAAAGAWRAAGDDDAASRAAWRAGDWDAIRTGGTPPEKAVADWNAAAPPAVPEAAAATRPGVQSPFPQGPEDGVLVRNRELLSGATAARAAIEDLLAAHPAVTN